MRLIKKSKNNLWSGSCLIAFLILFVVPSCTDLEENPVQVQLDPSTLSSDDALEALITGTYTALLSSSRWSDFRINAWGGDDLTTDSGRNKIGYRDSDWRRQTSFSERVGRPYEGCYAVITETNLAISTKDNIVGDQERIDRLIGEAHFLRGYAYFHLTMTYGRVPIQLEANSNSEIRRAEFLDIYKQIESDFLVAEGLLPDVYPGLSVVGSRPSKGTVKAFLARLYLHWAGYPIKDQSKYTMAALKAKEVIDNAGIYGYELKDDFRSLFTEAERFNQKESVFVIVSCRDCGLANRTMGRLGMPAEANGWNETFSEIAFFEDMQADAITNGTEQRFNDTYVLETIPRSKKPVGADWKTFEDPHPVFRKITGGDLSEPGTNNTVGDFNQYEMRFAEVLLTYAEATGRAGGNDASAWQALNQVRSRAGATTELSSADGSLADLAFLERKWELAAEYRRMDDLIRTETLGDALARRNQGSQRETNDVVNNIEPATSGEFFYFTPIPQSELEIAPWLDE